MEVSFTEMGNPRGGSGFEGEGRTRVGLDVLSLRSLLDSPIEILSKQLNTQLEIQGRVDPRDANLGVIVWSWCSKATALDEITQGVNSCGLNEE